MDIHLNINSLLNNILCVIVSILAIQMNLDEVTDDKKAVFRFT